MLELSKKAAEKIHEIVESQSIDEPYFLQVGVKYGGCSGLQYVLDITSLCPDDYYIFESHDVNIICDPKSFMFLDGTQIDYKEELMQQGFIFNNPNADKICGCGFSFSCADYDCDISKNSCINK